MHRSLDRWKTRHPHRYFPHSGTDKGGQRALSERLVFATDLRLGDCGSTPGCSISKFHRSFLTSSSRSVRRWSVICCTSDKKGPCPRAEHLKPRRCADA